MKEQKLNAYGMTPLTGKHYFVYGLGNFASQLSWTMVSTYLSIFYTDVFGLGVGAVALLMLIAKVWDGINDPMMGTLMERTHTRWGRISVAVYFYMHCVQNFTFITVFMMMQMIVGTLIMPFTPKIIDKFGKKKTAIISMVIQGTALIILFFGPYENIVFDFVVLIYYGLGYVAGPCGAGMMIDAIDDFDDKYGYRNDGMAFSFQGTTVKIATAIANSLFLVVMGAFGYVGGGEITPHVQTGINVAANLLPGLVFFMGIIPLAIYNLDKPGYMEAVRERLTARDKAKREAAKEA